MLVLKALIKQVKANKYFWFRILKSLKEPINYCIYLGLIPISALDWETS